MTLLRARDNLSIRALTKHQQLVVERVRAGMTSLRQGFGGPP
jgi:hypothetical protein